MKLKLLSIVLLSFFAICGAKAQSTVTGMVTDQRDSLPLPGVSIAIKGTTIGTQSKSDGTFSLSVPAGATTLVFTYIGYKELSLGITSNFMNIRLAPDLKQLSEVVVVGYGTQIKQSVTGAISTVTSKDIEGTPVTSLEQAMQGKTAGVVIQANTGKLGQAIKISVRGSASISAGTQPLVVVDGIIINSADISTTTAQTDPLADINFNDIESVQVLKDAASAAIYGARGSNGVLLITTKKGKAGTAKMNFTAQFGTSRPSRHRKFMNTEQWMKIIRRAGVGATNLEFNAQDPDDPEFTYEEILADYNSYIDGRFTALSAGSTNVATYDTDWEALAFQKAPQMQYDLNFSGGNDKTTYYISGQVLDQTGILKGNNFARYSGRVNVESKLFKTLSVGMNLNYNNSLNERLNPDNSFGTILQVVALSPITPLIDPRSGLLSGSLPGAATSFPLYFNPLLNVDNSYFNSRINRTLGNVFANWDITKTLTFRTEFGVDQTNQNDDSYSGKLTFRNISTPNGAGQNSNTSVLKYTINNFLTYKNTFGKDHSLDVTGGTSYDYFHLMLNDVQGQQFPSDAYKQIASAATITSGTSQQTKYAFVSYFARANYAYKGKYLFSVSAREDASSRFGANNRYGFFPAASLGWVLSEEGFLKNSTTISSLKLRTSYGLTGNAETGDYASLGLFAGDAGYNGSAGQRPIQIANPDLKWESTHQFDVGIDFGFFNNRLSGSVDYYRKNTKNLLLNVNVPGTSGFAFQTQNLGKLYNEGFELQLNSENLVGKFKWTTSFNAAYNKNVVTFVNGQILGTNELNRVIEGQPIGVFYGREYAGVDPANGDALYYRNTKNPDGTINRGTTNDFNSAENVPLGNPTPKYTGGITNTFAFKGFDLSFTFQGVFGNKIHNSAGQYMTASASNGLDNQTADEADYWDKPGDITDTPEPRLFYANGTNPSSRYLYSGTYVRLKTLSFGYTLPKTLLAKIKLERARVFVNAYNLFIITKYPGWDPEVNSDYQASNIHLGVDFYSAPQPRTITFGVNIGL